MSSEYTDVDALSESESSTSTDVGAIESSRGSPESYSGGDSEYSAEYSVCYDSSSSDAGHAGLPDWEDACKRAKREPFKCHGLNKRQRSCVSGWANSMLLRTGMLARVKRFLKYEFPVMSDCSGAEGGILSLQALGVQAIDHISSSEINCIATDFIARFSVLRADTDLLTGNEVETIWSVLGFTRSFGFPFKVLENVMGIKRCLGAVQARLRRLKEYYHGIMEIDSKAIGDVASRPRLYCIGIHRSVAAPGISSNAKLQNALDSILAKAKKTALHQRLGMTCCWMMWTKRHPPKGGCKPSSIFAMRSSALHLTLVLHVLTPRHVTHPSPENIDASAFEAS
ncbi:unnamed protein product [Symbiodinium necroappetens]|uniref:Uncharacterized protein n=1 Tax=Symbiodinium necroappetens TaxID=1628268 RepID=A0A812WN58_9DINO|nr:unnamed protein product [Symbiodinium necroappetens]